MACAWLAQPAQGQRLGKSARYLRCWHQLGDRTARLTRPFGLRNLLKMRHRPAAAAGLASLQQFLETGFDAFATLKGADEFLGRVRQRQSEWSRDFFDDDAAACQARLVCLLPSAG